MITINNSNILQTIDGDTLMNTPLPSHRFIVSSLLPEGLSIIGGAPKIGKSWLMLWLCLQVSKGEKVWIYETLKGSTLYLCLEDSLDRIQSRLFDITEDAPENLHFATIANSLDNGLVEQIEHFLSSHPDTVLIVIDTLQNIRGEAGSSNPYANDYRELQILKRLADKNRIAILLVHHLRKMKDDDPMNMLSGTTGMSGAVDTIFILDREKRTENKAKLFCTGRDIESIELKIEMDTSTHVWTLLGEAVGNEIKLLDEVIETVHQYFSSIAADQFTGTATELSKLIETATEKKTAPATLRKRLTLHHSQFKELGYACDFKRTHADKIIEIKKLCVDASVEDI